MVSAIVEKEAPAASPGAQFAQIAPVEPRDWAEADRALLQLLRLLDCRGFRFVTPTPATHAKAVARRGLAASVADVLSWSMAFARDVLPSDLHDCLRDADMLISDGALERSLVRVSSLHGRLFLHTVYPTIADDAVFLGPDSYRFADLIKAELGTAPLRPGARIVDIGTGAGVGAVVAATLGRPAQTMMTDINPSALRFARINAAAAGVRAEGTRTWGTDGIAGNFDLAVINPPYIIDPRKRAYRNGGGLHGGQLSLNLVQATVERLAPLGRLILYTGSAIVSGEDPLRAELERLATRVRVTMRYRELDPDVFGEELDNPGYEDVERIALVAAVIQTA